MDTKGIIKVINQSPFYPKDELIRISTEKVDIWHQLSKLRFSGEPYGDHPREVVALLLTLWPLAPYVFYAGAGHDAKEAGNNIKEIEKIIGSEAAFLVEGLSEDKVKENGTGYDRDNPIEYEQMKIRYYKKIESFWKKDHYLIIVKLADVLHNMRTIDFLPLKKQLKYMDEARRIVSFYRHHSVEVRHQVLITEKQPQIIRGWLDEIDEIIKKIYPKQAEDFG